MRTDEVPMLSLSKIVRGAFLRFLPTSALLMTVGLVPLILSGVRLSPLAPLIAAGEVLGVAAGYFGMLALLRGRLSADTPVDGRPSMVAGAVAPLAVMFALMITGSPHHLAAMAPTAAVAGAALGFAMFFPWLARPQATVLVSGREQDSIGDAPVGGVTQEPSRREMEHARRVH